MKEFRYKYRKRKTNRLDFCYNGNEQVKKKYSKWQLHRKKLEKSICRIFPNPPNLLLSLFFKVAQSSSQKNVDQKKINKKTINWCVTPFNRNRDIEKYNIMKEFRYKYRKRKTNRLDFCYNGNEQVKKKYSKWQLHRKKLEKSICRIFPNPPNLLLSLFFKVAQSSSQKNVDQKKINKKTINWCVQCIVKHIPHLPPFYSSKELFSSLHFTSPIINKMKGSDAYKKCQNDNSKN